MKLYSTQLCNYALGGILQWCVKFILIDAGFMNKTKTKKENKK